MFTNRRRLRTRTNTPTPSINRNAKKLLATAGYLETPQDITGTGKGGNVTKLDVERWLNSQHQTPPAGDEEE
jgi:hypothetical protein